MFHLVIKKITSVFFSDIVNNPCKSSDAMVATTYILHLILNELSIVKVEDSVMMCYDVIPVAIKED